MTVSKNVSNKKCAPKLIFFNEKKIEKDSDNFWYRKLTLKVKRLGDFALFDTSPLTQFSKFNNFLWVCWFLGKNLSNFVPPVWKLHNPYCHNVYILIILVSVICMWFANELSVIIILNQLQREAGYSTAAYSIVTICLFGVAAAKKLGE